VNTRVSRALPEAALIVGLTVLSAFMFVAFLAPAWPRTVLGWVISGVLGFVLLILVRMIVAFCFIVGPPRYHYVRRNLPSGEHTFRYHAGGRTAQNVLLAVRIVVAAALCGLLLWGTYALVFSSAFIRAQFR
jgi:hypothetical protein